MATPWQDFGAAIGRMLAGAVERVGLGDRVRAEYAARFGKCRRCEAPLAGPSPEQVCEGCHADEALGSLARDDAPDA